jgi:hypothetical protein
VDVAVAVTVAVLALSLSAQAGIGVPPWAAPPDPVDHSAAGRPHALLPYCLVLMFPAVLHLPTSASLLCVSVCSADLI